MNEQITFEIENQSPCTACVFTGHRELYDDFSYEKLLEIIEELCKQGVKTFYNGMAKGFDLVSAKIVLVLKEKYDIKLVACVPYLNQEKYFSEQEKQTYYEILNQADEKVLITKKYYKGCLLERNRYMVDRADCMVAYLKKDEGGTAYTVNYFKRKRGGKIYFV